MENNIFGISSLSFGALAVLLTIYTQSSIEMNDGLTETPYLAMQFSMLFVGNNPNAEPSVSSIGLFPLIDEDKRYFSNIFSYAFVSIGAIFALLSLYKKEHSFFYSAGLFAVVSTLAILSIKIFISFIVALSLFVGLMKKQNRI